MAICRETRPQEYRQAPETDQAEGRISSRQSRSSTLTVTITAVSRPNLGARLLLFTEIKPSKLLDLILLSNFFGGRTF